MQAWTDWDGPGLIYKDVASVTSQSGCEYTDRWEYWNFRGALAEALLKKTYSSNVVPNFQGLQPVTDIQMALTWGNNDGRISMLLNVYSECDVLHSSQTIFNILMTQSGSKNEELALNALKNYGSDCRVSAGNVKLNIENQSLRARLAIALYRINKRVDTNRINVPG